MERGGGGWNKRTVGFKFISYYNQELSTENMLALPFFDKEFHALYIGLNHPLNFSNDQLFIHTNENN